MIDEPENRRAVHDSLLPIFNALGVTTNPIPIKAALQMAGHDVGGLRLPMVEADEDEQREIRSALEAHGLLERVP